MKPAWQSTGDCSPDILRQTKTMKENLLDGICCPMCRGSLQFQRVNRRQKDDILKGTLRCGECKRTYPIEGGFPIVVPPGVRTDYAVVERECIEAYERLGPRELGRLLMAQAWT